jgi:hypothetical membrane protein
LNTQLRLAGIIGLFAPVFVFTCILASVASWPQFSWTNNALSDLGVQNGITAIVFNGGLVIGGILFAVFAMGLFSYHNLAGKVGTVVFGLACVMLIAIGVFNEHFTPTHYIVSVGLFTLMPFSMFIFVAAFWVQRKRALSVFTLASSLVAAAVWVLEFTVHYAPNVAVPEFISGLAGAVWVAVLSWLILKQSSNTPT